MKRSYSCDTKLAKRKMQRNAEHYSEPSCSRYTFPSLRNGILAGDLLKDLGVKQMDEESNTINGEDFSSPAKSILTDQNVNAEPSQGTNASLSPNAVPKCIYNPLPFFGEELALFKDQPKVNMLGLSDELLVYVFKFLPKRDLARCSRLLPSSDLGRIEPGRVLIKYLDLSMATVKPTCLERILGECKSLQKLSLENCRLTSGILSRIAQNRNIDTLNLAMCTDVPLFGLLELFASLTRLKSLNISWSFLSKESVLVLVHALSTEIEELDISGCRKTLNDDSLKTLLERCCKIRKLDISDSALLTEVALQEIVKNLPSLTHLRASRCYSIPGVSFEELCQLPNLKNVDIYGPMTDMCLPHLKQALGDIRVNEELFSTIARPTFGPRRELIWGVNVGDYA